MKKAFILRLEDEQLQSLKIQAFQKGISLNKLCLTKLKDPLEASEGLSKFNRLGLQLKERLKKLPFKVSAVALFGSVARGTPRSESDVDLLLVLESHVPLKSTLYRHWSKVFDFDKTDLNLSPHFLHWPTDLHQIGSLWLEASIEAKVIFDNEESQLENQLLEIRKKIASGDFQRKFAYGVPYWKRMVRE